MVFYVGDTVWYMQSCRRGYDDVPAVYQGRAAKRACIEVQREDGTAALIYVDPGRLRPRAEPRDPQDREPTEEELEAYRQRGPR